MKLSDLDLIQLDLVKQHGYSNWLYSVDKIKRMRVSPFREKRKHFGWAKYKKLYDLQKGFCHWCHKPMRLIRGQVEIDHINPHLEQGYNDDPNLCLTHAIPCNREKAAKSINQQSKHTGRMYDELIIPGNTGGK